MDSHSVGSGRGAKGTGTARRSRLGAAERRETILRAAAEVFAEAGYRAAKVSDVAARVGVTEPVVFQNFGSKAALFGAVVERAAADARSWLDAGDAAGASGPGSVPGPGSGSAASVLGHILGGTLHGPQGAPRHSLASASVLLAEAATLTAEPELGSSAREAITAVAGHLADLVRRAQSDGDARQDIAPDAAAWLLLSVLSARRLRAAAMPAALEPSIAALLATALLTNTSAAR